MPVKFTRPEDLESIELASADALQAVQLKRLQWTLNHAYKNVAATREAFAKQGVHPNDLKSLSELSKFETSAQHVFFGRTDR